VDRSTHIASRPCCSRIAPCSTLKALLRLRIAPPATPGACCQLRIAPRLTPHPLNRTRIAPCPILDAPCRSTDRSVLKHFTPSWRSWIAPCSPLQASHRHELLRARRLAHFSDCGLLRFLHSAPCDDRGLLRAHPLEFCTDSGLLRLRHLSLRPVLELLRVRRLTLRSACRLLRTLHLVPLVLIADCSVFNT
jgi:hypothetical protein